MSYLYMIISGLLIVFSFSNSHLFFLAWIALIPALYIFDIIRNWSAKKIFFHGWVLGITIMGGTGYWLYYPLIDFSGLSVGFVLVLLISLIMSLGLFYGIWSLIYLKIQSRNVFSSFLLAISWVGLEYLRYFVISVYPLGFLGYTQSGFKLLLQIAQLGGVFLVSFVVVLINGYLFKIFVKRNSRVFIPLIIFILLFTGFGFYKLHYYSKQEDVLLQVGIINTNISQDEKWLSSRIKKNLNEMFQNLDSLNNTDLIVTPESGVTFDFVRNEYYRQIFNQKIKSLDTYLQMGSLAIKEQKNVQENSSKKYNSSFLISPAGQVISRYDKMKLISFGEYFPWLNLVNLLLDLKLSSLNAGDEAYIFKTPVANWKTLICSEILYPYLAEKNIEKADFIVNQSNEAWFKNSNLHQQMWSAAVFRAVENRRSVVKAGNLAYGGLILPSGIAAKRSKTEGTNSYIVEVIRNREDTFYRHYGNYTGYISELIVLLMLIVKINFNISKLGGED